MSYVVYTEDGRQEFNFDDRGTVLTSIENMGVDYRFNKVVLEDSVTGRNYEVKIDKNGKLIIEEWQQ